MWNSIQAIAFDIDGTLYPNWRLYIRIMPYFFKNLYFFLKYNHVRHILHRTAPLADFYEYQARLLAEEMNISVADAHKNITEKVYEGLKPFFDKVCPYQHILETFQIFKNAGLKVAILSDFPPDQKGDIWGTAAICDVILGSEQLGALKPSKYTFGLLAKKLGVPPESVLYVGNSIFSDIQGARYASMKTAYIMPLWRRILHKPPADADIVFNNYRQLQKIVLQ